MKLFSLTFTLLLYASVFSQKDTLNNISFSAYGEIYYSHDFSQPPNNEKSNFLFNHKKNNEINANLIVLKANYTNHNSRANIGLMAGSYPQYNLNSEPNWAQFIYEANIGVKLSKKTNLWLDAGIFTSHIGFESAISTDCWTLTRSLLAENSPYYESGLKISHLSKDEKLFLSILYLNGWQKIQKPNLITKPSFGVQITYKPTKKLAINYSNFMGTDLPDSLQSFRHFHNIYAQFQATKKLDIIAGFDIGFEKTNVSNYKNWFAPVIIVKQQINNKVTVALRGEYYEDKNEIIIKTGTKNGFQTFGFSSNVDVELTNKIMFRAEAKMYHSKDEIFNTNHNNYILTTNLSVKL